MIDGYAGWDPKYKKKARVIATRPYHAMFMKQMLMRDTESKLQDSFSQGPDFTVINAGEYPSCTLTEDVTSKSCISVNFSQKEMVILGS